MFYWYPRKKHKDIRIEQVEVKRKKDELSVLVNVTLTGQLSPSLIEEGHDQLKQ